ncbi:MAG: NAD(P)H-quinone oxidoreductase [Burkholderiales bacterium]
MKTVLISRGGGPEVLTLGTRPVPKPEAGQVLIKVAYAGVNRADCEQRIRGFGQPGATDIPGLEVSGEIVAVGPDVTKWRTGDRVCALVNGGGYAQYCVAAEPITLPVPPGFDLKQAAALPETVLTAWHNVFMMGRLKAGEWLLVHGGSSGVGTMAIQIARLEGARVIATAGSATKCEVCLKLGATSAINYREEDFVAAVQRITEGHGADVILDMAQGLYAKKNLEALAMDGRIVHLNPGPRYEAEYCAPLGLILTKRAIVTGSRLRVSSMDRKKEIVSQVMARVWGHLGREINPIIDSVIPFEKAAEAHARMESSMQIGKILLEVSQ